MKDPAVEACAAIVAVIKKGSPVEGSNEKWREHSAEYHIQKAYGHLFKHKNNVVDGENHITHALTRLAMALCIPDPEK